MFPGNLVPLRNPSPFAGIRPTLIPDSRAITQLITYFIILQKKVFFFSFLPRYLKIDYTSVHTVLLILFSHLCSFCDRCCVTDQKQIIHSGLVLLDVWDFLKDSFSCHADCSLTGGMSLVGCDRELCRGRTDLASSPPTLPAS